MSREGYPRRPAKTPAPRRRRAAPDADFDIATVHGGAGSESRSSRRAAWVDARANPEGLNPRAPLTKAILSRIAADGEKGTARMGERAGMTPYIADHLLDLVHASGVGPTGHACLVDALRWHYGYLKNRPTQSYKLPASEKSYVYARAHTLVTQTPGPPIVNPKPLT